MAAIVRSLGQLVGIGGSPKADVSAATDEVDAADANSQQARSALLETEGGQAGSTLQPGQVSSRQTLLGN